MSDGKCIQELERIKGIRKGSAGKVSLESDNLTPKIINLVACKIILQAVNQINPMKMAKCIVELERIKGVKRGGDRGNQYVPNQDNLDMPTQSDLANKINISQQQLGDYKKLLKLIPELQTMVENGSMKATVNLK